MRKSKKYRVLYTLTLGVDIFSVREFPSFSYKTLYALMEDIMPATVRSVVASLVEDHYVSSYRHDGKTQLVITSTGREHLLEELHAVASIRRKWDTSWRFAVFSGLGPYPKAYRLLRELLQKHRFAQVERGVYISPYPVPEEVYLAVRSQDLGKYVIFLETKKFLYGDERIYANRWWNLERIATEYTNIGKKADALIRMFGKKKRLNNREKTMLSNVSLRAFLQFCRDPGLPVVLLPPHWRFDDVLGKLSRLFASIESRA